MPDGEKAVTLEVSHVKSLAAVLVIGVALGFSSGFLASTGMSYKQPVNDNGSQDGPKTVSLDGVDLEGEPSMGDDNAPVKIVEYTDLACPYCAEWTGIDVSSRLPIDQRQAFQQVKENLVDTGKAEFIVKDYPAHPNSMKAHVAANCVLEQSEDAYWEYHDLAMEERDSWMKSGQNNPEQALPEIASRLDIDQQKFEQCYSQGQTSEPVQDAQNIANSQGRVGTPTFFIGNQEDGFIKVSGAQPFSQIQKAYEKITS